MLAWKPTFVSLALVSAWSLAAPARPAEAPSRPGEVAQRIGSVRHPCLLLGTGATGEPIEAPLLSTAVEITVRGPLARTVLSQRFSNPTSAWVEGVYVLPLPVGAAVDRLRMMIGERIVEGQIMEHQRARRTYEQARREGRRASLVEQERPNMFTASVANIAPLEAIEVVLEYQETLRFDDDGFSLRFPMVVGPRYVPGRPASGAPSGLGWAPDTKVVPDGSHITPPVDLAAASSRNPVRLTVDLDAGMALDGIRSPSHAIRVEPAGGHRLTVTLDGAAVPADRDFVLQWSPARGTSPRAALFVEDFEAEAYALLVVVPPAADLAEAASLPRSTVFVIDTSGSMHGASIDQARTALAFALDQLRPDDEFNVIQFNSVTSRLFEGSRQAFPATVDEAREYVAGLDAEGGTKMLPALAAALEDRESATAVRQVVFITDGCVGDEERLFAYIRAHLGRSRLFTVGIGSAPNSHFMERSARFGRGTFTYIGRPGEAEAKMRELFRKIDSPQVSDIDVIWPDAAAESFPERIPDLYAGEPVVVAARMATLGGEVLVTGRRGLGAWQVRLPLTAGEPRGGVHQLWARRRIVEAMDSLAGGSAEDQVRAEVVPVALRHHLTSRFTSLVAVDVTPARPGGEVLASHAVPTNLPHGWSAEAVFGQLPQGATPAPALLLGGLLLLAAGIAVRLAPALRP